MSTCKGTCACRIGRVGRVVLVVDVVNGACCIALIR